MLAVSDKPVFSSWSHSADGRFSWQRLDFNTGVGEYTHVLDVLVLFIVVS